MTTDDIIAMRMMGGPFTVVKHGEYFWVADKDGFRICAFVDIGHPEVYAEYVAALMDAGNDYCDLIGPNQTHANNPE